MKDRLNNPGTSLSGGQQQRLCIARTIAVNPEVILMDEPCSALDPIATARIEDLIDELRASYAIVIVTHSMQQAARVSQRTAYFHLGDLIEVGETDRIFTNPAPQADRRLHHRAFRLVRHPQQLVDGGLGARLLIHALDDDRAGQGVTAVGRGQRAGHHHGARRHATVGDRAAGPVDRSACSG